MPPKTTPDATTPATQEPLDFPWDDLTASGLLTALARDPGTARAVLDMIASGAPGSVDVRPRLMREVAHVNAFRRSMIGVANAGIRVAPTGGQPSAVPDDGQKWNRTRGGFD